MRHDARTAACPPARSHAHSHPFTWANFELWLRLPPAHQSLRPGFGTSTFVDGTVRSRKSF
jgi:hypothetical protein